MVKGDIIVKIDQVVVNSTPVLQELIAKHRPGDKVSITALHSGKEKDYVAVLENKDGNTDVVHNNVASEKVNTNVSMFGANFSEVDDAQKGKLGIEGGAQITKLGNGKFRNAGIREGFIITLIDKKEVYSVNDVLDALKDKKGGTLIEGVYPNGMKGYYGFGM